MKNITLLFPGQGAQYVGMGQKLIGTDQENLLDRADEVLGYDLKKMMLEGPEEELTLTQNTQPAILTYSVALHQQLKKVLDEKETKTNLVMGHSVGEYAALVAAGVLKFEDAVKAVHNRGKFMQEAVPAGLGKMVAVMKVSEEIVISCCNEASSGEERVMPANFNEPNQIVISGHAPACDRATKLIEEKTEGACRLIELKVSAPFHSSLMEPAAEKLDSFFNDVEFNPNETPYTANIDAKKYETGTTPEVMRKNLVHQVAGSVLWTQSFQALPDDTLGVEVGPGRVLMPCQKNQQKYQSHLPR